MPELPEVQTVVDDLNKKIKGSKILGVFYCDNKKAFKGITFEKFKKEIKNRKIIDIKRRAKYILINLTGSKVLIFHLKMTGHLLVVSSKQVSSKYIEKGRWVGNNLPKELLDPRNQFIHLVLELSGDKILAFSDVRKFGVIRLENSDYLSSLEAKLGPEPLDPKFDLNQFKKVLDGTNGKIKAVLMDQSRIAGIGNIYGDEILFLAGVRPDRRVKSLKKEEVEKIFKSIRPVLEKAIKYRGSSESDYRDTSGKKGDYQNHSFVYRREKNACGKCGGTIKKIKIGQRSAHYCTECQK
ncbi:MAG: bifunctional DNA-formamidopyrimidine glycosylase/DNA-(apurinic or apyrimidinic site) lyase [Patescibacteria group bacterium]|nr:bifunctional DNA-formamidopyrimidine glycosylase/DNA-(apurinic or apyrimidinic site) lyase [Patescibacteria group bacterium]